MTDHRRDDLITSTSNSKPFTSSQAASTSSPRNPAPPRPSTTSVPPTATVEPKDPKAKTSPSPVGVKVEQSASVGAVEKEKKTGPKFREFKAQKAALSLVSRILFISNVDTFIRLLTLSPTRVFYTVQTPTAVEKLKDLMASPTPQQLRISVTNKGCAGMSYNLSYVTKAGRFDEVVEQDGVRVLIDSKALFSIIGSEMDWKEERLGERFVFKNPNIKEECGCGESFLT